MVRARNSEMGLTAFTFGITSLMLGKNRIQSLSNQCKFGQSLRLTKHSIPQSSSLGTLRNAPGTFEETGSNIHDLFLQGTERRVPQDITGRMPGSLSRVPADRSNSRYSGRVSRAGGRER